MKPEDGVEPLERPLLDHAAAAGLAFVVPALLARLKEQSDVAGELAAVGPGLEQGGRSQQHRGVGVVTAGVHDAGPFRVELGAVLLEDGERVHVGPQPHRGAGGVALDVAHNAGLGDAAFEADTEVGQRRLHQLRRALLGVGEFGVAVDGAAPLAQPFVKGVGVVEQAAGGGFGGHGAMVSGRMLSHSALPLA